ncbi:MAG: RNA polymerase Rpb4 [Nitrososphaerota archaeon]|jgi:DNA-directed RNA polymerase subunit F|nr:RNA polymerase Rpb4 [Nitrososphaerota archaeon]
MSQDALGEKCLTLSEVKKTLEVLGEENLDQFQRRTLDYVNKFAKVEPIKAEELVAILVKECELDETEAVQIVNCVPETVDELRVFIAGGRKIIEAQKLEKIVSLINENRILK